MPTQENGDIESANRSKDYNLSTEEPKNDPEATADAKNSHAVQSMEVDAAKVVVYKKVPCDTVSKMLVNYHGIIFTCGLLLIFILSAIGSQNMQIAENVGPSYDFTPNDHPAVESFDAISAADKKLDSLTGTDKPLERSTGDLNYGFMQFLYKSTKSNADIFTAKNVQRICTYEQQFYNHKKYDDYCILSYPQGCKNTTCASCTDPVLSVGALFYGANIVDYAAATAPEKVVLDLMSAYYYDYTHNSRVYKISSMFQVTRLAFNFRSASSWKNGKSKQSENGCTIKPGRIQSGFLAMLRPGIRQAVVWLFH